MGNLEVLAKEREFLDSMVDLTNYPISQQTGKTYPLGDKKYSCDPCDACGPDACATCKGCAED